MIRMLPGCKPGVYFATVILEVLDICHKKLLFERCLQRRLRVRLGAGAWKRSAMVPNPKGIFSQDLLPVKINFLLKQMGQTHVNKLFKLLQNSQGVLFKSSTRLPDLVFNYTEFKKSWKKGIVWTQGRRMLLTGHQESHSHGARMVSPMALVTILFSRHFSVCFFLPWDF